MSKLFPKITSPDPEEAVRAFRPGTMDDKRIDSLLKRDDIFIKDHIFRYVAEFRPALLETIRNDPSHPFHMKANSLDEDKRKAEEKERQYAFLRIVDRDKKGERGGILEDVRLFIRRYGATDEEKCALGEIVYRTAWGPDSIVYRDTKLKRLELELRDCFCPKLAEKHLCDWPEVFPKKLVEEVLDSCEYSESEIRDICLAYRIARPPLVTACEVGQHSWEKTGTETVENREDSDHPQTCDVYRCTVCGETMMRSRDRRNG
ncbi:MAG: hypothetical protein J5822_00610 [Eubacteriaceae bacterium]|nr:hypothetical protein [Eubacteriaceae bacterium]